MGRNAQQIGQGAAGMTSGVGRAGIYSKETLAKLEKKKQMDEVLAARLLKPHMIDLAKVYEYALSLRGDDYIAVMLGMSASRFQQAIEKRPEIRMEIHRAHEMQRGNLANAQLKLALAGHAGMLIWLGKQQLGQVDKHEQHNTTEISIIHQRAMDELRGISKDKLIEAQALLTHEGSDD